MYIAGSFMGEGLLESIWFKAESRRSSILEWGQDLLVLKYPRLDYDMLPCIQNK